jgi:hypothetical protein
MSSHPEPYLTPKEEFIQSPALARHVKLLIKGGIKQPIKKDYN